MMASSQQIRFRSNCAFDYYPSSFATDEKTLMGLQAANEGFLRAFLRYGGLDRHVAHVRNQEEGDRFRALVEQVCGAGGRVDLLPPDDQRGLAEVGALLHPFPGFGPLAWNRNFHSPAAYSLLGITHTTATQAVMDSIGNLAISPIHEWDAVVCTSTAVRKTYENVLELWEAHLMHRLGARRPPRPQLPIIPLGVDTTRIVPATPESRRRWRTQLNIGEDAFVVLWVGRFNHAAKAHPIPTYLALEQVAQRLERPLVYLQSGWFANEETRKAFAEASQRWSPSVVHRFVDGRQPQIREAIWHAADVFLSLSDNLQETFGLTPIEAMAAQLPVVVSDWDGYRDTVRDGLDGFRIPTRMPAVGYGDNLAQSFCTQTLSYGLYCGVSCQSVAVDLEATARALETLACQPQLCRRMGEAGRCRARDTYEWAVVIDQYQQLLSELAERRAAAVLAEPRLAQRPDQPAPLRADPYAIFASYPTATLDVRSQLCLASAWREGNASGRLATHVTDLHRDCLHSFAAPWRLGCDSMLQLLAVLEAQPGLSLAEAASQLDGAFAAVDQQRLVVTAGWLLKLGVLAMADSA